ncbi:hypothetical protein J2S30_002356 [Herbaspirillum rubrisubalbicans]|jgi:hypothetical protein|nr:hypothetical protein [Herbaspirillum rubrisubalbicans]MCP1573977.1 hypothetical protein [Herbaspirillum rubrisubalbicans]
MSKELGSISLPHAKKIAEENALRNLKDFIKDSSQVLKDEYL